MKKNSIKTLVAAVVVSMVMANSTVSASANEGLSDSYTTIVRDANPQPEEETHNDEPAPEVEETHNDEPAPEVEETPAPEPTPAPVEETHNDEPAPAPAPEPTPAPSNDDNGYREEEVVPSYENNETTEDVTPAPVEVAPVVPVSEQPAVAPVVAEPTVVEETKVAKSATKVSAAPAVKNEVLGVDRVEIAEDIEDVEVVEVVEEESEQGRSLFPMLLALLALLAGLILLLMTMGRKYQVVKRVSNENGTDVEVLGKFFSIEKAAEFARDYEWDTEDDYDAINIINTSRKDEYDDEDGNHIVESLVYFCTKDMSVQGIHFADDHEMDVIGRVLGFVQNEVLA